MKEKKDIFGIDILLPNTLLLFTLFTRLLCNDAGIAEGAVFDKVSDAIRLVWFTNKWICHAAIYVGLFPCTEFFSSSP